MLAAAEEASVMKKKGAFGDPFPLIFVFVILNQNHLLNVVWMPIQGLVFLICTAFLANRFN